MQNYSLKSQGPLEGYRQKVKAWVGTKIRITDTKTTRKSKNTKIEHYEIFGRNGKSRATRNQKSLRRPTKKY